MGDPKVRRDAYEASFAGIQWAILLAVVCFAWKNSTPGVAVMVAMLFGIAWNLGNVRGRRKK